MCSEHPLVRSKSVVIQNRMFIANILSLAASSLLCLYVNSVAGCSISSNVPIALHCIAAGGSLKEGADTSTGSILEPGWQLVALSCWIIGGGWHPYFLEATDPPEMVNPVVEHCGKAERTWLVMKFFKVVMNQLWMQDCTPSSFIPLSSRW